MFLNGRSTQTLVGAFEPRPFFQVRPKLSPLPLLASVSPTLQSFRKGHDSAERRPDVFVFGGRTLRAA